MRPLGRYLIEPDGAVIRSGLFEEIAPAHEQRITEAGHDRAYLWVLDGNERADAFYARHGWLEDGAIKIEERPQFTLREHRRVKTLPV